MKLEIWIVLGALLVLAVETVETLAFIDVFGKKPTTTSTSTSSSSTLPTSSSSTWSGPFRRPSYTTTTSVASVASAEETATATETSSSAVSDDDGETTTATPVQEEEEEQKAASLTFGGEVAFDSNALPLHPNKPDELLSRFFKTPSSRNLFVTGGGERPCVEIKMTPELMEDWTTKCQALGACVPNEKDCILSVTTPGVSFPGLTVNNIAVVGTKYVEEKSDSPRHEFVLLSNESEASGLPPVVWLYNKLTGNTSRKNNVVSDSSTEGNSNSSSGGGKASSAPKIRSLSTVSYKKKNDDGSVVFTTNASLSIGLKFPKLLMKALGDKSKAEQVGAKSIRKTLDKDIVQSMSAFEKAYMSYLDEAQ